MNIVNSFTDSLTNLKPLYYHLLDGYLNENSGSDLNVIKNMFINFNKELPNINLYILHINENPYYKSSHTDHYIYSFINLDADRLELPLIFDLLNTRQTLYERENPIFYSKYFSFFEFFENIEILKTYFTYCIYQTTNDEHATSILFRIHDNKMYISCFNSGMGINLFKD